MSTYAEILTQIRAAKKLRDEARDSLYQMKIDHLALKKALKKQRTGEIEPDEQLKSVIGTLRQSIAALQNQLQVDVQALKQIRDKQRSITEGEAQLEELQQERTVQEQKLSAAEEELRMQVSEERKTALRASKKEIEAKLDALGEKTERLRNDLEKEQRESANAPGQEAELDARRGAVAQELVNAQELLGNALQRQDAGTDDAEARLKDSSAKINDQLSTVRQKDDDVFNRINVLFERTPQQLVEEWDDNIPVLLLPVRIETRFKITSAVNELWVRVFPDDLSIVTHEKMLTVTEIDYGTAYWKALWTAGKDEEKKKTAWRMVADKFGSNRAAWATLQIKPLNWDAADTLAGENDLVFPSIDSKKTDSWTEAPHTRVLPDKFVLLAYRAGELIIEKTGRQVSDIVILGPAPLEDSDNPGITRNETTRRLEYGEDLKWLSDFELAVEKGLGFKIPLDAESVAKGFDQLIVLGLKHSSDDQDGKMLLEDLLNNHHYSKKGLALVPQGTPTNNTEESDAGFSSADPFQNTGYVVEAGDPLFTPAEKTEDATDGQRLAEYLGIEYGPLQNILNSNAKDYNEAVAMNKALYAGTLGYYLFSLLNEVMDDATIGRLRHHFNNMVTGRGPIAAIRVGNQPYGILPTSDFTKWKYPPAREVIGGDRFTQGLYDFLLFLQKNWAAVIPQLSHISKTGDAGANLMDVLGLQPASVEFFQRIGYSFDSVKNQESFQSGGRYTWDVFKMNWDQYIIPGILRQFGYNPLRNDETRKPMPLLLQLIYQHYHTLLDAKNLVDNQPLSEQKKIKPYDEARDVNYIHWLLNNSDPQKLQAEDFEGSPKPTSLLYMMLRHALLLEASHSIYKFLKKQKIDADELIRSRKFMNITNSPSVSHWEIFNAPVSAIVSGEVTEKSFFEHIYSPGFSTPADIDVVENLNEQKWALNMLKDLPTARLERAFAEHLDTLTYRLDAWQTSVFDLRLRKQRGLDGAPANRHKAMYIGAYGYLEMAKQGAGKRTSVSEDILPASLREGKDNLFEETANGGYVHAPSLNHATAAAVLRNAYLTHASPDEKGMMNINLSSERVRRAKYLIEGIRNGQSLEVLLGYQFERGLHEWTTRQPNPVILNDLIPLFRKDFPIKKTKVPQQGNVNGPEETIEDYHVTNGLALANSKLTAPYITASPALNADKVNAIKKEKENIENTLDALRDVLMSESAYQLALGNFDRAAAVLQSISNSQLPPDIEVINTTRGTSLAFTNRFVIHFDTDMTLNPWPGVSSTQRALTEPGMNYWMGGLLGDPAKIQCKALAVDAGGIVLKRADDSDIADYVSLEDLNVQPIDFIYLIRNKFEESGTSELETRVRFYFAQKNSLSDDTIVKIEFGSVDMAAASPRSFSEILPFANYIRELISGARPLGARSFEIASRTLSASTDNPDLINIVELKGRVENVLAGLEPVFTQLGTAVADVKALVSETTVGFLRNKLKQLADNGYVFAFPQSASGFGPQQAEILLVQGKSVLSRFESLQQKYNDGLSIVNTPATKPPEQVATLSEMMKLMLGADFVVLPHFNFGNPAGISQAFAGKDQLLDYSRTVLKMPLPVDEWLHGVAAVRPRMHNFEMIRLLNDSFNADFLSLSPMQLPYRDNDSWVAIEFPHGTTIDHDTLSFIQYLPQGFSAAKEQCGVLIDDWTEGIGNRDEVTGIAFNYNQPNSVPPQAILMVVTPEETGHWKWDDLVSSVMDTFKRAKQRAVEPDKIDAQGNIAGLFPALISEFSAGRSNISLDYALNIAAVFEQVASLQIH